MGTFDFLGSMNPLGWVGDMAGSLIQDQVADSNAKDQYQRNQWYQEDQYNKNIEMYKHRFTWSAEDLRRAGLNPILAASGGFSGGAGPSVSQASAGQAPTPQFQYPSSTAKVYGELAKTSEETKRVASEVGKINAEANYLLQKAEESVQAIWESRAREKETEQREKNLKEEFWNIAMEFQKKSQEIAESEARTLKTSDERKLLVQQARQIKYIADQLQKVSDAYRGPTGDVLGYIRAIAEALGIHIGVGVITK